MADLTVDPRYFGRRTPFVAIAAVALSFVAYALLWGLGVMLALLALLGGALCMLFPGPARQTGTGVVVGIIVFVAGFAAFLLTNL
ncbi:hypothetical protein [Gordonia sp. KTR9]|uniref:hypothetical protein n=1 Tax=Gordonia sp. KTR9 TaxID=337191 RepID=UPI00027DE8DE|nr:hypothetical protein [Gordonia sp. KTR9]AFR50511.1 hypothetical protein KTR9_3889 [Gordonia sp. KTR9]